MKRKILILALLIPLALILAGCDVAKETGCIACYPAIILFGLLFVR